MTSSRTHEDAMGTILNTPCSALTMQLMRSRWVGPRAFPAAGKQPKANAARIVFSLKTMS
eukprot:11191303-Lingulodinium_polyedra.AAC.1